MSDPGQADVRDILVVELLGGIGDILLVLPAVHALAQAYPAAAVRVLTYEPGASLLTADPHVAEVVPVPKRPGLARDAVVAELARRRPDLAVTTTRYDGIADLVSAAAPRSVTDLWRRPPADQLVDVRFLDLLAAYGVLPPGPPSPARVYLPPAAVAAAAGRLAEVVPAGPPALLVVDAGMAVKRWPAQRWAELAAGLAACGLHPVVVAGDAPDAAAAAAAAGAATAPALDLPGLAAFFAAAAARGGLAVAGDTGPGRLAAAAGLPVVALFGATAAARYGMRGERVRNLQGLPDCPVRRPTAITEQDCWWTAACPYSDTGPACMADLSVDAVLSAALEVAPGRPGGAAR